MSHSDNFKQKSLDLYKLRQSAVASSLHSNLAQPIVAAKNFAAAIKNINGDDENLLEAKQLAGYILDLTDQAYTVAYDLMLENQSELVVQPGDSMESSIKNYSKFLRFKSRGITLNVYEASSSASLTPFIRTVTLDWVKSFLIYLARHTKVSIIKIGLKGDGSGFSLEIDSNVSIDSKQIDTEPLVINIREQIQIFDGDLLVKNNANDTRVTITLPPTAEILNAIE